MTEPPIVPFPTSPYCRVRARVATKSGWAKDTKGRWWKLSYLKKA